jgi:hypothetical protein
MLSALHPQLRRAAHPVREAEKLDSPVLRVDERGLPSLAEITALAQEIGPRLEPAV